MKCLDGSNDVKVYNLTASKNLPDWMTKKKKKKESKKQDDELLQDFQMPDVSNCLKLSPDGQYLMVCGTYKPVLKCYELAELCVKFERGMDAEVIRIEILGEDYSKIAFLQDGRYVELHGQNGKVDRLRVPRFGRDMCYHSPSSDIFVATSGSELYRLNVSQGRFLNPVSTNSSGINRLHCNRYLNLMGWCTDDGVIEYWDPRSRSIVASLSAAKHVIEYAQSNSVDISDRKDLKLTAMAGSGAFTLGVGTQGGQILMYDIRSTSPFLIKDHYTKAPIDSIHFHNSGNVFSMSPSVVKIWDKNNGSTVTSIESEEVFNDMEVVPNTGLAFFASEHRKMKAYFIPSLGPAPSWCAHLDAMTEEMEEDESSGIASQYDDYTFVSNEDLIELGLKDLIGTSMLRASMHGYYINTATYNKVKKMANPVLPANVIKKKLTETLAKENTIKLKEDKKDTNINSNLLPKLMKENEEGSVSKMASSRFKKMFKNSEYSIDSNVEKSVTTFENLCELKKDKSSFKKRALEIQREDEEMEVKEESEAESEADSIAEDFGVGKEKMLTDSDENEEDRRKFNKMFKKGPRKRRRN